MGISQPRTEIPAVAALFPGVILPSFAFLCIKASFYLFILSRNMFLHTQVPL
jgi:hypothetical protein